MSLRGRLQEMGLGWMPDPEFHPDYPIRNAQLRDDVVYVSGKVPIRDGKVLSGKVGADVSLDEAVFAAANCALMCLYGAGSVVDPDDIVGVLRMRVDVNCTSDFTGMSAVADGASHFLIDLFGEEGICVRTAIAAMSLPLNAIVEITMEVLVRHSD